MSDLCPACGSPKDGPIASCSVCQGQERDEYLLVKNYLRTHPNSNAMQVANATGVPVFKITRYIREGVITIVDRSPHGRR